MGRYVANRVESPKRGKGKRLFTKEDVANLLGKPPNYKQPDGKLVRYEDRLVTIQALDSGEIVTVKAIDKMRPKWEEV